MNAKDMAELLDELRGVVEFDRGRTHAAGVGLAFGVLEHQRLEGHRLALVLPCHKGEEPLVAIPMVTTMGWVQLLPTFSTMSETVCNLTNKRFCSTPP